VPWINGAILNLINKKNHVRKKLKKSPTCYLKLQFKKLRSDIKNMLRESRKIFFKSMETEINKNPKRFWSILKNNSKSRAIPNGVSIPMTGFGSAVHDQQPPLRSSAAEKPQEIANLFNSYFISVFSPSAEIILEDSPLPDEPYMTELCLTVTEVQATLEALDVTKATGPDGIPAHLLKETASVIAPSICKLFNKSLTLGIVPNEWKNANVVPVFKKGEADYTENYRPISLLSLVSKVLERCVLNSFKERLREVVKECQHGFLNGKSCTSNLLEVLHHIGSLLDNGSQIDVVYMDMSKAFDKVCHSRMLQKLREFGFGGSLLRWFGSYLTNRYQRVTALGATSESLPISSGVPQGSILGPALFLLYVNDLPDAVKTNNIAMFADDTKTYQEIKSVDDVASLQDDLDRLDAWSNSSGLAFNGEKCKTQRITRKVNIVDSTYCFKGKNLELVNAECDLGVWISNNLTWNKHVYEQTARANKLLGYIKRNTSFIKLSAVRRSIYLALVRPLVAYATQIWAPQSIDLIIKVERIQRRSTKYILNLPYLCPVSYSERLKSLHLLPLTYWHEYLDMVFFFKMMHGLINVSSNVLPSVREVRSTRSSSSGVVKYVVGKCKTSTYQKSYVVRSTRIWNTLADELNLRMDSIASFKSVLLKYYFAALDIFDCDNPRTFKTVCLKCNCCRSLVSSFKCCN
jgi:hypothetical protein